MDVGRLWALVVVEVARPSKREFPPDLAAKIDLILIQAQSPSADAYTASL
jgi:hypothetical protein